MVEAHASVANFLSRHLNTSHSNDKRSFNSRMFLPRRSSLLVADEDFRDQNILLLNFLLSLLNKVLMKYLEKKRQRKLEEAN